MEFTCSHEFAAELIKQDPASIAPLIARKLVETSTAVAVAKLVLTREEAVRLLTERLIENPKLVLDALDENQAPAGKNGKAKSAKRLRTGPIQAAQLVEAVLAFLKAHPASGRAAICAAVPFASAYVYMTTMAKLLKAGKVKASGVKRAKVYSLR